MTSDSRHSRSSATKNPPNAPTDTTPSAAIALPDDLVYQVQQALREDLGSGDITASLIDPNQTAQARVIAREPAILCGQPWFNAVFAAIDPSVTLTWAVPEGALMTADQTILELSGNARSILTAERTALNFLQTLSGTATTTHRWVSHLEGTDAQLLDTRKTIPGLRTAQKYAVKVGGGQNHRMGLFDQFLIKENHIMAAGSISAAIQQAKRLHSSIPVEVEVETLAELEEALQAQADIIMLDNFSLQNVQQAVVIRDRMQASHCKLEVSGAIEESALLTLAETGVDFISVGALTKHVQATDFSMRFSLSVQ